jgi:hypothetical protein
MKNGIITPKNRNEVAIGIYQIVFLNNSSFVQLSGYRRMFDVG